MNPNPDPVSLSNPNPDPVSLSIMFIDLLESKSFSLLFRHCSKALLERQLLLHSTSHSSHDLKPFVLPQTFFCKLFSLNYSQDFPHADQDFPHADQDFPHADQDFPHADQYMERLKRIEDCIASWHRFHCGGTPQMLFKVLDVETILCATLFTLVSNDILVFLFISEQQGIWKLYSIETDNAGPADQFSMDIESIPQDWSVDLQEAKKRFALLDTSKDILEGEEAVYWAQYQQVIDPKSSESPKRGADEQGNGEEKKRKSDAESSEDNDAYWDMY